MQRVLILFLIIGSMSGPVAGQESAVPQSSGSAGSFEEWEQKATLAREADQLVDSIEHYLKALELRPSWAEGWWYLGTVYYELDRYAEGRDAFRRLLSIDSEAGPAWALLGLCEYQVREYERALSSLQKARAQGMAGNEQLDHVSRYHEALLLTRFEKFEASQTILAELARTHYDQPQIVEAYGLSALRMPFLPIEYPPDRRELILMAGRAAALAAARRMEEAEREYMDLLQRYPQTPHVHYSYGVFLLSSRPEEALETLRRELEITPDHVPGRVQIAFEYIRLGREADGLPFAEKAVELDPANFAARNALGRIYMSLERLTEAVAQLEEGVRLAPDSPQMHFALGRAYARAGRKEDSERSLAEFQRLDRIVRSRNQGAQAVGGIIPQERPQ